MQKILIVLLLIIPFGLFAQQVEKLEYLLSYGIIKGGTATLTSSKVNLDGEEIMHLKMRGKTIGLTHKVYAVDDIYESWVSAETNLPQKAIRNIKEKKYKYYNEVEFYHQHDSAYSMNSGAIKISGDVCDIVSAFNFIRKTNILDNILPNDQFSIPIWHIDKVTPLLVQFHGIETIKTKNGKIECLKLQPLVETGKLFKRADSFVMWVTNDENKLPILFQFNLKIGALKCELIQIESDY